MKIALLTNIVSPHQLPLAKALINVVGEDNYRYVYTQGSSSERANMGWGGDANESWMCSGDFGGESLQNADVVIADLRDWDLVKTRNDAGKKTFYTSERWFKPSIGILRLLHPGYLSMVLKFLKLLKYPGFILLPQGVHAARDFARLVGLFKGDLRCLFRAPKVAFESKPGGVIVSLKDAIKGGVLSSEDIAAGKRNGFVQIPRKHWGKVRSGGAFDKMRIWGYFVEAGIGNEKLSEKCGKMNDAFPINHPTKLLWVGRMIDCKRVDVLVRAARPHPDCKRVDVSLNVYGEGETKARVQKLALGAENISFHDFVPIAEVRNLMRRHDVYVLPSNEYEGWGAVLSEALEEGMKVLGSYEAGSSATILPHSNLFHCRDVKRLRSLLSGEIPRVGIGEWSAANAAQAFLKMC